ncbi:MAG: HlyD family efflux transporter periplasmic adaptor subunit [Acidobacteria bacterium]|nr:HlyD family efflux transporter periplasmic adaptor subunit [Acidobacteriota bacterium]
MKRVLPLVILVAALGGGYYWWRSTHAADDGRILLSGNLELKQYEISFKTAGRLVELTTDEGAPVKKGALLARIDPQQVEQTRDREQAAVRVAETQLAQSGAAVEYQKAASEGEIALRRAEVAQTQAVLRQLESGNRPQEKRSSQAAVEDLRVQLKMASADWERAQKLYKNDDISTAQYEQWRTRQESLTAAVRQAEQRQAIVEEGPRVEEIEAARANVARAQAALRLAEASRISIRQREQEALTRRAEIERARLNVQVIETQLSDTRVVAPADGVVMVKSTELGDVVAAGTSLLTIGDLDHPWLRGYVSETQLGRVKLGQRVKITTDSYPGKVYEGRVSFISPEAEFTPKQIQTKEERVKLVYRIKVDVDNTARELKANMPVDAEILMAEK